MPEQILNEARAALDAAPPTGDPAYTRYCHELAAHLTAHWADIQEANRTDLARAEARGLPPTLVTRLRLTDAHLAAMVRLTEAVASELATVLADAPGIPAGDWGVLRRVPKPLGVAFMIYEARPTVTVDGALLPVAVGNAVLLRGGKESAATDAALATAVKAALRAAGLPPGLVTVLDDPDRSLMKGVLARPDQVDVLIPRGSPSLIDYCRSSSSIPLIASGGGVNHLYVHRSADLELAARATLNSKIPEPAGCTSVEMVLVDEEIAQEYLAALLDACERERADLTVRLDASVPAPAPREDSPWRTEPLEPHDTGREFLDPVIALRPVSGPQAAAAFVRAHGSQHTEGIVARDREVAREFTRRVDAAMVVVNGSLRLHDGPKLGLGSEIAIATGRLHVRGPVTLGALVTSSWVIEADGQMRD
ncbi:Gamma-glutamyl phosphate reductase [Streptomyces sp. ADI96-02]|uniref:glutamate-5-semialdehyde dehydrogenase n=1 Tax=unclassified Streptomyces TaxID=2593676 RepID=UPI000F555A6E|nr:glutamate-5-semialdehyde dehydrogenase [Streptomyces sp. ADI96-02]RPK65823.1 Gamma-glutamyl phosphate reductase [Streptomyces sp. ADI96-02]